MKKTKAFAYGFFIIIIALTFTACDSSAGGGSNGSGSNISCTHNWGAWMQTVAATCTTEGLETRQCTL
ncbi:MAG: hypothetical protein FWF38_07145, partial [Spirochaetaceae bacterium]|nr:hypothetical protein [Spirochaetaceae bacterium]